MLSRAGETEENKDDTSITPYLSILGPQYQSASVSLYSKTVKRCPADSLRKNMGTENTM
jgi:hypothetical protein